MPPRHGRGAGSGPKGHGSGAQASGKQAVLRRLRDRLVQGVMDSTPPMQEFGRYDKFDFTCDCERRGVRKISQLGLGEIVDVARRPPMRVCPTGVSTKFHTDNFGHGRPKESLRNLTRWAERSEEFQANLDRTMAIREAVAKGEHSSLMIYSRQPPVRKTTYRQRMLDDLNSLKPLNERLVPPRKLDPALVQATQALKDQVKELGEERKYVKRKQRAKAAARRKAAAAGEMASVDSQSMAERSTSADLMSLLASGDAVLSVTLRAHIESFIGRGLADGEYGELLETFGCDAGVRLVSNYVCRKLLREITGEK